MPKRVHLNLVIDLVIYATALPNIGVVGTEATNTKLVLQFGLVMQRRRLGGLGLDRRYGLHGWNAGSCRLILCWLRSCQFLPRSIILALLENRRTLLALRQLSLL